MKCPCKSNKCHLGIHKILPKQAEICFRGQLWKLIGTKLSDKADLWKSNNVWSFKTNEGLVYIENISSENQVLTAPNDDGK